MSGIETTNQFQKNDMSQLVVSKFQSDSNSNSQDEYHEQDENCIERYQRESIVSFKKKDFEHDASSFNQYVSTQVMDEALDLIEQQKQSNIISTVLPSKLLKSP